MRNTLKMLAAAALALTSTIGMAAEGDHRFTHEGQTYIYSTADAGKGRTVITGRRLPAGDAFRLVVRGDRVTGVAGGAPVSFRAASAKGAARGVEIAAN